MADDDDLAERLRRRDTSALAAYLEARRAPLLAFIERRLSASLRGKVEPQDVLQNVAVKALNALPQTDLTGQDPFGWLCHLAEQCIVDDYRHFAAGKRDLARERPGNVAVGEASQDLIALLAASLTSPTQAVARNERHLKLQEALAALSDEHREVLRLRYAESLPTKEVAKRIGKTDVATRVLLTRLVRRLQELLGPEAAP